MLSLFHLHWDTYSVHVVVQVWWKCQCVSVSIEVSVFKGFSGRTLRNAFGKKNANLIKTLLKVELSGLFLAGLDQWDQALHDVRDLAREAIGPRGRPPNGLACVLAACVPAAPIPAYHEWELSPVSFKRFLLDQ